MGRDELEELPVWSPGAWKAASCARAANTQSRLRNLGAGYVASIEAALDTEQGSLHCDTWIEKTALSITREEYANLFHSLREMFNSLEALQVAGIVSAAATPAEVKDRVQLVFLDGHAESDVDAIWAMLFGQPMRLGQMTSKDVCFRRVVFPAPGARCSLSQPTTICKPGQGITAHRMFADYVFQAYDVDPNITPASLFTLVGRRPYVAHPRSRKTDTASRHILNEVELLQAINASRPDIKARLAIMSPDQMSFGAQLALVRRSRVLAGFHGAAMAHLLFVHPQASVLELTLPRFAGRTNFAAMARGTGVTFMTHLLDSGREEFLGQQINVPTDEFLEVLDYHIPAPTSHRDRLPAAPQSENLKVDNMEGNAQAFEQTAEAWRRDSVGAAAVSSSSSRHTRADEGLAGDSSPPSSQQGRPANSLDNSNNDADAFQHARLLGRPAVNMRTHEIGGTDHAAERAAVEADSTQKTLLEMQRAVDESRRKQREHIQRQLELFQLNLKEQAAQEQARLQMEIQIQQEEINRAASAAAAKAGFYHPGPRW